MFTNRGKALTFDDILLVPSYSEVTPDAVDISTWLTPSIELRIPLLSAAMDTVTESAMAISMARMGGIGIIHKNMPIERQRLEVERVKKSESGMILDPVTVSSRNSVQEALDLMADFRVSGLPVVDDGKLVGILTNRDVRFIEDASAIRVGEVMTSKNLVTVPMGTSLEEAKRHLHEHRIEKLLVVDENERLRGLITMKDIDKVQKYPNACKDSKGRLRVAAGVGVTGDSMERVDALVGEDVDAIVLDSAHGLSANIVALLRRIKAKYPELDVVVGNIATAEAAKFLIDAGADGIKVGIGPGSICTTRIIAGVGVPQLSAIYSAASAARGTGVPVIADGGLRYSGDIVKALAAGGDCVMIGSMFAGTEESPGDTIIYNGRKFKSYRGMGSIDAMKAGSADRYFQKGEVNINKLVPEGIVARVPFKGSLSETVYQLVGGIRAGMGYCGAADIETLKQARFIRITANGVTENHPHDVTITSEAPNYSSEH